MKWIYFLIINVIAFSLMGLDKRKAKKKQWRTPESTLFYRRQLEEQLELGSACICFIIKLIKEIVFGIPLLVVITVCLLSLYENVERNAD